MSKPTHINNVLGPWLTRKTYPRCQGKLKTGETCLAPAYRKVGRRWLCSSCLRERKPV